METTSSPYYFSEKNVSFQRYKLRPQGRIFMVCSTFFLYTYDCFIRLKFVTETYIFFAQRKIQFLCESAFEKLGRTGDLVRIRLACCCIWNLQYIANSALWSLTNLKNFVIERTCRWLFDQGTLYSRAKKLDAIDLPYITVFLSYLVSIVLVCDLVARFDRTVRWLSAYPKFGSYLPWQCRTLH